MPSCLSVGSRLLSHSGAFSGLRTVPSGGTALTSSRGSRPRRNHRPSPRITVTIAAPMMESGPPADEKQPVRPSDPGVLQVLANEHWSLLATRSLTYSESLSRVSMFLSVLAGAVIALALVAQADRFGQTFVLIAILVLSVVLFIGVATVVRLEVLNHDDLRWVMGMNRIRHAYLERHPELEPYFVTTKHDDFIGVSTTLGYERTPTRGIGQLAHGVQTLPGMVGVVAAVIAGALVALI